MIWGIGHVVFHDFCREHVSGFTVWFVVVEVRNCTSDDNRTDDYGHVVPAGFKFNKGHFLELVNYTVKDRIYKQSRKITYFYKESILYPNGRSKRVLSWQTRIWQKL